jgi:hypothetical protein
MLARRCTLRVCAGCDDGNGTTSPRLRKRPSTHQRGSSHRAALIDALGRPRIPAEVGHEKLLFNFSLDDARSRQCETSASISCVRFRSLRVPWKARSARAANSLLLLPPLMDGPPLPAELVRLKGGRFGQRRASMDIAVLGIDLGKNSCSVVALDGSDKVPCGVVCYARPSSH